mgnify:CR=1 FL=1
MGDLAELLPAPRAGNSPATGPAEVVLFPSTVARARWLRREALRIAAGVNGASVANVRRILEGERARAGLQGPAVAEDVAAAVAFVEAVRDAALMGVSPFADVSRFHPVALAAPSAPKKTRWPAPISTLMSSAPA